MSERRRTPDALFVAVVALCVAMAALGAYIGAYYWRTDPPKGVTIHGKAPPDWNPNTEIRLCKSEWEATMFKPAAKVESWLKQHPIWTVRPNR